KNGAALLRDYDRDRRWGRTFLLDPERADESKKRVWDRSVLDRYRDPGQPVMRTLSDGQSVLWRRGDALSLPGQRASPKGDRPLLDRLTLKPLQPECLFESDEKRYNPLVALVGEDEGKVQFVPRHESPSDPPNYRLCTWRRGDVQSNR